MVGFEVDFGYSPNFFEVTEGAGDFEYGDNNVTTLMANVVLGAPIGGQTGGGAPCNSFVDVANAIRNPRRTAATVPMRRT